MNFTWNRKYTLLLIPLLLVGLLFAWFQFLQTPESSMYAVIDGKQINLELADTVEKRIKGLGGRTYMEEDSGMLFIFDETKKHTFWMKGMQFALDFIWIKDNQIIDTLHGVPPPNTETKQLPTYGPKESVNKVLEINAGWINKNFPNEDIRGKTIELFIQ